MYKIIILKKARKSFKKIPAPYQLRIKDKIAQLSVNPFIGKCLEGDLSGRYSIRVWPYRIIYSIEKNRLIVEVLRIEHRQGVYKR